MCCVLLLSLLWLPMLLIVVLHVVSCYEFPRVDTPSTLWHTLSLSNSLQSHTLSNTHTPQPQKMTIAEKMGGSPFVRDGRNVLTKLTNKAPVKKLRGENTRLVRYCYVVVCCVMLFVSIVVLRCILSDSISCPMSSRCLVVITQMRNERFTWLITPLLE